MLTSCSFRDPIYPSSPENIIYIYTPKNILLKKPIIYLVKIGVIIVFLQLKEIDEIIII